MSILKLNPSFKDYLWGGDKLKRFYNKRYDGDVLAESWELACHKDGECTVANGPDAGLTLKAYLEKHGKRLLGENCTRFTDFPVLVKLIDAKKDLSIQVHPSDEYALAKEGQYGKTEMWYIVECDEGASLYYGLNRTVDKETFRRHIENNTLTDILNRVNVKKGDVLFVSPGTIHAIRGGILIAEIQQNSNLTYRVYDYGRLGADGKPRPLHVEKAMEIAKLAPPEAHPDFGGHLAACDYFVVDKLNISGSYANTADKKSFHYILVLDGEGTVGCGGEIMAYKKGDSLFIPADSGEYQISGSCNGLLTTVGEKQPAYRIGIDMGGTNIKIGLIDKENNILSKASIPTKVGRPYQEIVRDMADTVHALLAGKKLTEKDCVSVGIGCPGTIDFKTGMVVYANNYYWEDIPLAEELKKYIGLPVLVSNDANCAALGEVVAGAAKGCKDAVMITLGTGVGGGVIIDGKVFEGGFAGGTELGHTVIQVNGEPCTCGRRGCLEAYASATALIREAKKAALAHPESMLYSLCGGDVNKMDGVIPFKAARAGDETGKAVVDQYITWLSEGIVDFINIFRPEKVLLSGGICNEGSYLTDPINAFVQKYSYAGSNSFIPPVERALLANDAGMIGAANLS